MRAVLLAGLATVLAAAAAGCGGSGVPDGLSDIRVCTDTSFDPDGNVCTGDERGSQLVSSKFNCSIGLANRAGKTIVWRFLLNGEEVASYTRVVPEGRGTMATWVEAQPAEAQSPLPGGRWECNAAIGAERIGATFESAGPTEPVQALAACRTSATVPTEDGPRMCPRDESSAPIPGPLVTCSAGLAGAKGSRLTLTLLRSGATVLTEGPILVPKTMNSVGAAVRLPPGDYTCSYALDGRTVATKRFTVA